MVSLWMGAWDLKWVLQWAEHPWHLHRDGGWKGLQPAREGHKACTGLCAMGSGGKREGRQQERKLFAMRGSGGKSLRGVRDEGREAAASQTVGELGFEEMQQAGLNDGRDMS